MQTLKVNEIFYSLQGEGYRAGHPSIFVRLAGCDLSCKFCDTEFESGEEMRPEELLGAIQMCIAATLSIDHPEAGRWIVWTGGEPALQLTDAHVEFFKDIGYQQAIETNGNHPMPGGLDWIACSPKVAEHVVKKNHPNGVDELRYVRHANQFGIPEPLVEANEYYLSPMFDGDKPNRENLTHCINLCLKNPKWNLSIQSHKLFSIL